MLRISRSEGAKSDGVAVLRLAGRIDGPWVEELRRACDETLGATGESRPGMVLDLTEVSFIGAAGLPLLREMLCRHVRVTNCSRFVEEQLKRMGIMMTYSVAEGKRSRAAVSGGIASASVDQGALVNALKAGEDWAFESMVRLHGGRLLAVARRITRDEEDARDAVQAAFLNAFRAIQTFDGGALLSTWLHRIVVNCALMKLRTQARRLEEPIEKLLPTFDETGRHTEQCSEWTVSPEQLIVAHETRAHVRECITQLPDGYREVLVLRDIEDYSTQDVAELLSISPNAVKVRLHRARQALLTLIRASGRLTGRSRHGRSTLATSSRGTPHLAGRTSERA